MKFNLLIFCFLLAVYQGYGQDIERWDKHSAGGGKLHPGLQWFKEAKFGIFVHWGLYSMLEGHWKDKDYYGSGEWLMYRAKVPAAEYAAVAGRFNPVEFNAQEWAKFAKDAGARYLVITAKHHEGFSMYDSKVSDYTIVKASPYKKDPMKDLSSAIRAQGLHFGFYYSQYLDWHEPNGGGNEWDFKEGEKNYQQYYREKSIPQLKELMTNYGPLGIVWFDMPGGLTKEQTQSMIDSLHLLQPNALFSSRVGQGLGDYMDFGDSETPSAPIDDAWESIYTHNDSWGYIANDKNFKSPEEIIRLLATVASRGGNLMLNIGPDGRGRIPEYSQKYILATGAWLKKFGESIYGSSYGLISAQPWGVTTSKPGKLFLHLFERPENGLIFVPGMSKAVITQIYQLDNKKPLRWFKKDGKLCIPVPELTDKRNTVLAITFTGHLPKPDPNPPVVVSSQYKLNTVNAASGKVHGRTTINTLTFSHYFGDWKHTPCVGNMKSPDDVIEFTVSISDPGDYKLFLEYSCPEENGRQEGVVEIGQGGQIGETVVNPPGNQEYHFETLRTSAYSENEPLLFLKHPVAISSIKAPGLYTIRIHPLKNGKELFQLKALLLEPVR
ncbi:alpha-L-fucosidase [Flavitalea flava]